MRWSISRPKSAYLHRQRRRASRPTRAGRFVRPSIEPLELRLVLDARFSALATMVDGTLGALQDDLDAVVQNTSALPVLGKDLDGLAGRAQTELADLRAGLQQELGKLNANDSEAIIENKLRTALAARGLLHDIGQFGYGDDVNVDKDAAGGITLRLNVGKKLGAIPGFSFDTGLPGLGFRVYPGVGGLDVSASIAYDQLTIGLNPDSTPFFDANSHDDEFSVIVGAGLKKGSSIDADLGFLSIVATDATPGKDELSLALVVDVQGNSLDTIRLADPHLEGDVNVALDIRASFATANLAAGSQYPSISTRFVMQWDLDGSKPDAGLTSLGQEPSIRFENVTLNVGTFLNTMLGPVASTIRDFMRPMDPILKIITTEIPVLSDISKEAGLGEVTLKSLAIVAGETAPLPPDYDLLLDLFNASTALHELLINVDSDDDALELTVGSFDLSGKDVRTAKFDASLNSANLTDLIPRAVGVLRSVNQQLEENMPDQLAPAFDIIDKRLRSAENGAGFNFPIFDDPLAGVFRLLIGQDSDFVNYTAQFHIDGNRTQLIPLPIPLLQGILNLRLNVQYDADAYLKVGYDTYGLRMFLKNGFDVGQLANGLYFDAQRPLMSLEGSVSAGLAATLIPPVKVPVLGVEVPTPPNVSINGEVSASGVVVRWGSQSAKFRVLEEDPSPLFNTEGIVKAGLTVVVEAGIPGVETIELYKKVLSERVLFDLYSGPLSSPKNPFLTPPPDVIPIVDVIINLNRPKKEWFTGPDAEWPPLLAWAGNDGVPDVIEVDVVNGSAEVRYNGYLLERHKQDKTLGSFFIKGTDDDDSLLVDGLLHRPVDFQGGLGVNGLTLDDRDFGGNMAIAYDVSGTQMKRRATDALGRLVIGELPITHGQTTNLTLFSTNVQGASFSIADLYNNDLQVAMGRYENQVTIDTTYGGWASTVELTSPLNFLLPFRPLGPTRLAVKDQTLTNQFDHGAGKYVISDERLTRQKFMPLNPDNPRLIRGGTGALTIDYGAIKVVDFRFQGGDRGNDVDLQSISLASRYQLLGGAGADTFTIGQVNATLPGGTQQERQLGFAAVDMSIDGRGGLTDKLILDDTGSDFLPYTVRNTFEVFGNYVGLDSEQDFGATSNTVSGRFFFNFIEDVTVKTGGVNTVNVRDTVSAPDLFVDRGQTRIVGGSHTDIINVLQTTGSLTVDGGGGANFITIGAALNDTGSLDLINGDVHLTGKTPGALNFVTIMDQLNDLSHEYFMDAAQFHRSGGGDSTKYVLFDDIAMFALTIRCGDGGNNFRIDGSPTPDPTFGTQIDIHTGDNDDFATVRGTNGPVSLNLGEGFYQTVSFGDEDASLDNIRGDFTTSGGGFIDAFISNEADAAFQYVNVDSHPLFGQFLERYNVVNQDVQTLNRFRFPTYGQLQLQYQAGQGGDVVFVSGVEAAASVLAFGTSGVLDTYGVGFGADMNRILGPVYLYGQAVDHDFSYYYDYLNPNPQSYQFSQHPLVPQALVAERFGIAPVTFTNLGAVLLYAPPVGGNDIRVTGLPAQTVLSASVGADVVTLGRFVGEGCVCEDVPLFRTMEDIQGAVSIGAYRPDDVVRLTLDDSGNADTTPRNIEITPATGAYAPGTDVRGLPPASIYWNLGDTSYVSVLGSAADETFALTRDPVVAALAIAGGGGVNTLDYLSAWDQQVTAAEDGALVNLADGTATGALGGISSIHRVIGSPGNDILIGDGGSILDGRGGRDILIAGDAASILLGGDGEDLLIAGTTSYDHDQTALAAILAEWTRTDISYQARVANLTTDNGSTAPKLKAGQTVFGNGGGNELSGGADAFDLFFASLELDALDPLEEDEVLLAL